MVFDYFVVGFNYFVVYFDCFVVVVDSGFNEIYEILQLAEAFFMVVIGQSSRFFVECRTGKIRYAVDFLLLLLLFFLQLVLGLLSTCRSAFVGIVVRRKSYFGWLSNQ